ncbi:MAG: hypothetical protein AAGJ34_09610 [Pseudomonadota bacterium]
MSRNEPRTSSNRPIGPEAPQDPLDLGANAAGSTRSGIQSYADEVTGGAAKGVGKVMGPAVGAILEVPKDARGSEASPHPHAGHAQKKPCRFQPHCDTL